MARFIRVQGVQQALSRLDSQAQDQLRADIDEVIERNVRTMANEAAVGAPRDTGKLANSITASVEQLDEMAWRFGSDVDYATRQEYEHASKKGYFRKAVWNNRETLRRDVNEVIGDI